MLEDCHDYARAGAICSCAGLGRRAQWEHHIVRLRITRKTAKRVYFVRSHHYAAFGEDPEIGYVNREKLERDGYVYTSARWYDATICVYAALPEPPEYWFRPGPGDAEDLSELKRKMAEAHPDVGGTNEEFIARHQRYVAARQRRRARDAL